MLVGVVGVDFPTNRKMHLIINLISEDLYVYIYSRYTMYTGWQGLTTLLVYLKLCGGYWR